ncbi:hypothetical protein KCG48_10990 [Proteiniclasticum sp. BAD-10]|jgi:hypothetical protein|uniref:Uncharacterized protein n=1 Tax=Proteiniclasticum sediminis TaxID=2804028 RepID=A0A941HQT7_9CLOT|nr:hypothetical protein [Proteiniclasticum sediminis]MBR0576854.1 hypothetical protein [Proteiniclasticum sediminis]
MELSLKDMEQILKYLRMAKDQQEELYQAMIDIENLGEVDHDGMPVVNSRELSGDIKTLEELILRFEAQIREKKGSVTEG